MKKRVRIYKPTNKFAAGGTSSSAQYTPDQLVSLYMTALAEPGSSAEQAEDTLRQIGVDENTISLISDNAQEYVNDEQYFNDALGTADADALTDITADQAAIDAGVEEEQNALAEAEEEARSAAMQEMYADYNEPDYGDDTDLAGQLLQRYGGMPSKRTFVRNVLKQVKKQMGGDSAPATVDSTDPNNDRKGSLQAFTNAVKVDGELNLAKQDAEEMYKMMTTPIGAEESYYEEPDMDYAQFGGMRRGQMRRMNKRMNRMIGKLPIGFSGMPGRPMLPGVYDYTDLIGAFGAGQMPADGSYYRGPKMANIDVRRTGLFGRPKEYTITFADDVVNNPQTAENVAKQEVKNKEEEVKDEVKAAEEGTVDQGVEQKKAEEAATQAEEEAVDINDIQVVSGNGASGGGGNQGGGNAAPEEEYVAETEEEAPVKSGPAFKGFWQGYDPSKVRYVGSDKSRAYVQRGNKWFVSPNFQAKDKKNVQWYEVSDPNRIKNIKSNTRKDMSKEAQMMRDRQAELRKKLNWDKVEGYLPDVPMTRQQLDKTYNNVRKNLTLDNLMKAYESLPDIPGFQQGGFADQSSGLYQFVYGGNDNFALQSPAGKLENDSPYFAKGGLYRFAGEDDSEVDSETNADTEKETETPSYLTKEDLDSWWKGVQGQQQQTVDPRMMMYNQMMNNFRTKQKGLPYLTGTDQAYTGSLDDARVKSIKVDKTKAFGPYKGMPKKYTINYQVQKHPLTGEPTTQPVPTKQGLFNRDQQGQAGNNLAERMINSKVRPISVLGAKLLRNYTGYNKEDVNQNPDQWGIDQLVEDTKRRQNAEMVAQTQLPTRDLTQTNLPEAQLERTPFVNTPSGISQSLPIRRPGQIPTNVQDAEIIPTQYSAPLAPGAAGPLSQREAEIRDLSEAKRMQEEQDMRGFGMNLLGMPTAQEQYTSEVADQNALETQRAEIQRMIEQNPDFYTQGVYNNPVFNPEDMTTSNIIDFNPKPVQQIPVNREVDQVVNRVTTPKRNVVPVKNQSNTNQPSKQTNVPRKQSNTPVKNVKVNNSEYDYENTTKGMSRQEKANWQAEQGDAASTMRDLKNAASQGEPKLFRETYKNYKIDPSIIRSMNKLSPSQRLKYLNAIKKQSRELYEALLYKYGEYGGYMAYGGTLPQAVIGEDTPVNQDQRFAPDYESVNWGADFNQDNIPDYLGASTTDMNWRDESRKPSKTPNWMQKPYGFNEEGEYSIQKAVEDQNPQYEDVSADFKNKGFWGAGAENRRIGMNIANPIIDFGLNIFDKPAQDESWRYETSTASIDRGKDVTNSGLDFPAEYGQRQFAKYGGYYQNGGLYNNSRVGEYMWMTPEMIQQFLEEGGELEFI